MCDNCDKALNYPLPINSLFYRPDPKAPHPKFVAYCKEEFEKANNPRYFGSSLLVTYLVDERNQRYGMLISYKMGDAIHFGWSVCQTRLDKWDKYVGFHYAFKKSKDHIVHIPEHMTEAFAAFVERTMRYFKVPEDKFISNLGSV